MRPDTAHGPASRLMAPMTNNIAFLLDLLARKSDDPVAEHHRKLAAVWLPPEATHAEFSNALAQLNTPDQRPPLMTDSERLASRKVRDEARYRLWPGISLDDE